jgi:hypothetical protein
VDVTPWPLSAYCWRSYYSMHTDSLDGLGTRLEHRITKADDRSARAAENPLLRCRAILVRGRLERLTSPVPPVGRWSTVMDVKGTLDSQPRQIECGGRAC